MQVVAHDAAGEQRQFERDHVDQHDRNRGPGTLFDLGHDDGLLSYGDA